MVGGASRPALKIILLSLLLAGQDAQPTRKLGFLIRQINALPFKPELNDLSQIAKSGAFYTPVLLLLFPHQGERMEGGRSP